MSIIIVICGLWLKGGSFFCTGWSLVWLMGREILIESRREILIESTVIGFFSMVYASQTNVHPSIMGKEERVRVIVHTYG